jgi:hypothetical protein|nr:MAG TPA: Large subunit terminase [Caudoviricetes sp.]
MEVSITKKQQAFIDSQAFETLFGGAAGGGKSYGQLVDGLLYALKYPKSKQIIFRSTFADLEKSLIRTSMDLYPLSIADYNSSKHTWKFKNGSIVDFGYIQYEKDVYQYQSAEYDVIRFDELTHFTEFMYTYMISRCRGANPYPKCIKSSTNPGGVGHNWVKERFIDIGAPNVIHTCKLETGETTTRIFIPSLVQDNKFMLTYDPDYIKRLDALPEKERRALKYGDWDIFDGQFFTEFKRDIHVIEPFEIPKDWYIYFVMDYGLDKLAGYWIAVDYNNNAYVFREVYESNLLVSQARDKIKEMTNEQIYLYLAPPDLWNRHKETGKSTADIFEEGDITLYKTNNDRIQGWLQMKEWLKPYKDEQGCMTARLKIFNTCKNLIRCLPRVQHDEKRVGDIANEPHELTHSVDAIRGFCVYWTQEPIFMPKKQELPFELQTEEEDEDIWY